MKRDYVLVAFSFGSKPTPTGPFQVLIPGLRRVLAINRLRLLILDPKSHITLWTLNQVANAANRDATARKNFDKAMNSLVATIKDLVAKSKED